MVKIRYCRIFTPCGPSSRRNDPPMSPATARRSRLGRRLGAVVLAAVPTLVLALPREPFGWFAYRPLVTSVAAAVAGEAVVWADMLLPVALALLVLWAPAWTRLLGLPLTLLVIAADVVIPLRYPWTPSHPSRGIELAALAAAALLLAVARPGAGAADRRAAAGWTVALVVALWPVLRMRLALADPATRCGEYVHATTAIDDLSFFKMLAMGTFGVNVCLLAVTAVAAAGLGARGARVLTLVTVAGLTFLVQPITGYEFPATCLLDLSRWPYLVAALFLLLARVPGPVRRLRP